MSDEQEDRKAFIEAHGNLDFVEMNDAWGRPMFKHTHIEAMWVGWRKGRATLRASAAATSTTGDPLVGLDERLDRLCLTEKDTNNRFILSTESAKNIVGIVREWLRVKGGPAATPCVPAGAREAVEAKLKEIREDRTVVEAYRLGRIEGLRIALEALPAQVTPTEAQIEAGTKGVRDEYGSRLCMWEAGTRHCRTHFDLPCMCREIASHCLNKALCSVPRPQHSGDAK